MCYILPNAFLKKYFILEWCFSMYYNSFILSVNFFGSLLPKHSTHLGFIWLENPLVEYSSLAQILQIFQIAKMKF